MHPILSRLVRGKGRLSFDRSLVQRRHGGAFLFLLLFLGVSFLTRVALYVQAGSAAAWGMELFGVLAVGFIFDLGAALFCSLPLVLLLALLPRSFFDHRWARMLTAVTLVLGVSGLIFGAVAEWFFWEEFSSRFNFIAVDYLVYTHEVIANIRESYPMPIIFSSIVLAGLLLAMVVYRTKAVSLWLESANESLRGRWTALVWWSACAMIVGFFLNNDYVSVFKNTYHRELAKNGVWSLFAAFRNNELDYEQFYATRDIDRSFENLRNELSADGATQVGGPSRDTLRFVRNVGEELRPNVIQITVESLSADFLSIFNRVSRLTPNLEALASQSLVFENFYATGTRTDRGMEALTLAIPPTPGRSLVKRPKNDNLFTLGSIFRSRGYDTAFIYGGFGYFDNMNAFFGGNGYRVVDRATFSKGEITFANAWGACDEDLFRRTLKEADASAASGRPFHFFVMTTSNHRPFTYPEGRIDLPPGVSGRAGAVKYTDFAIGEFLRAAAEKPWFKTTVFVIVADHCASVAGKTELPVRNYHIPLFIYAPGGQVAPGRIKDLTSQVDYAPTLLGLLNWSYMSRFFGWDVRQATGDRRVLIGNYQRLGLYEPGELVVLNPKREINEYEGTAESGEFKRRGPHLDEEDETIAYYQTASYLYKNRAYRALSSEELRRESELKKGGLVSTTTALRPALP
ncbi:MAG TPA: sulfatase-like hydrolase/transferase [Opitutaceae bacterium]|nr:sulfatase-like hydrolase/transferase [Opitutaceae bacterium]